MAVIAAKTIELTRVRQVAASGKTVNLSFILLNENAVTWTTLPLWERRPWFGVPFFCECEWRPYLFGKAGVDRSIWLGWAEINGSTIMKMQSWLLHRVICLSLCLTSGSTLLGQDNRAKPLSLPEIIKKVQPSTALIITYGKDGKVSGQGSGFFVSQTGHIITNRHVLEEASRAEIKTAQGKIHPITHIIAEDKEGDLVLASVDIPLGSVHPLELSKSVPQVGQHIVVIGNPFGLVGTVSDGIVSAVRDIPAFGKIIQISAPISPGSSGSPVVNMKGQVIGIATSQMAKGQNLNFAMPSQRAAKLKPGRPKTLAQWQTPTLNKQLASAEQNYRRALAHLWKEDYKQALPFLEKAAEGNPQHAKAWFCIGFCMGELGRWGEAVMPFRQVIRINPEDAVAWGSLSVAYGQLGLYRQQLEAMKQVVRINPEDAVHWNSLGVAYGKLGSHAEAITAYKQAIRIRPDSAQAHYNLGAVYFIIGRYPEAIEAYKQVIRIKPDYAKAYYFLGTAHRELGRYAEAIAAHKQAIRIEPDYAHSHNSLGLIYGSLGRYTEAIAAHKQAIRIKPDDAAAHNNLGFTYSDLGRHTEAVAACKEAIRINPDYGKAHHNLGLAYGDLGRYAEAIAAYKQAIRIKPDYAEAHNNLGNAYTGLGRYAEAIAAHKQAIRIKPDYAYAHTSIGSIYHKLGRYTEAIAAHKQAIRIDPEEAHYYDCLGVSYVNLGRHAEAITAYKQAIRIRPDNAYSHLYLGLAYLITDDKGSALEEYKILKELDQEMANELFNVIYR